MTHLDELGLALVGMWPPAAQDNIPPMSAYMAMTLSSNAHISAFQSIFASFPYYTKLKPEI